MIKKWELVESKIDYRNDFVTVLKETLKRSNGELVRDYYAIARRNAVYVIALTYEQEVPLVYQYKNGVKELIWELPAGFVEDGEEPLTSGQRELLEETGYQAEDYSLLGQFVPNPSLSANKNFIFLARNAKKVAEQKLDKNEEIEVKLFPIEKLVKDIREGQSQFIGSQDQLGLLLAWEKIV